ncbi:hypothetical protein DFJ73DRAFT_274840 [Zopfochytrium polystomum]|nr:hypothetical protein DFJ73DRAFT_274840 [Zopfochytrium polystomum]
MAAPGSANDDSAAAATSAVAASAAPSKGRWTFKQLPTELAAGAKFRVWTDLFLGCDLGADEPIVFEVVGIASVSWVIQPDSPHAVEADRIAGQPRTVNLEEEFWKSSTNLTDSLDLIAGEHGFVLSLQLPDDLFPTFSYEDDESSEYFSVRYVFRARFPARDQPVPDFEREVKVEPSIISDTTSLGYLAVEETSQVGAYLKVQGKRNHFHSKSQLSLLYSMRAPPYHNVQRVVLEVISRYGLPGPLGPSSRVGEERVLNTFDLPGIPAGLLSEFILNFELPNLPPSVFLGPLDISHELRFVVIYEPSPLTVAVGPDVMGASMLVVLPNVQNLTLPVGYDDVEEYLPEDEEAPRELRLVPGTSMEFPPLPTSGLTAQLHVPATSGYTVPMEYYQQSVVMYPGTASGSYTGTTATSYVIPTSPSNYAGSHYQIPPQFSTWPGIVAMRQNNFGSNPPEGYYPVPPTPGSELAIPQNSILRRPSVGTNPSTGEPPRTYTRTKNARHSVTEYFGNQSGEDSQSPTPGGLTSPTTTEGSTVINGETATKNDADLSRSSTVRVRPPVPPKPPTLSSGHSSPSSSSASAFPALPKAKTITNRPEPFPKSGAEQASGNAQLPIELQLERLRTEKMQLEQERKLAAAQLERDRLQKEYDERIAREKANLAQEVERERREIERLREELAKYAMIRQASSALSVESIAESNDEAPNASRSDDAAATEGSSHDAEDEPPTYSPPSAPTATDNVDKKAPSAVGPMALTIGTSEIPPAGAVSRQPTRLFDAFPEPTIAPILPQRSVAVQPPPLARGDDVKRAYVKSLEMYRDRQLKHFSEKGVPMTSAEIDTARNEVLAQTGEPILMSPNVDTILEALHLEMKIVENELQEAYEASSMDSIKSRILDAAQSLSQIIDAGVITKESDLQQYCDEILKDLKKSEPNLPEPIWVKTTQFLEDRLKTPLTARLRDGPPSPAAPSDAKGKQPIAPSTTISGSNSGLAPSATSLNRPRIILPSDPAPSNVPKPVPLGPSPAGVGVAAEGRKSTAPISKPPRPFPWIRKPTK